MSASKVRPFVLSIGVAAITATGAWYGAGLKTRQEFKQERTKVEALSNEDRVAQLEEVRHSYVKQRDELQAKIDQVTSRAAKRQAEVNSTGDAISGR